VPENPVNILISWKIDLIINGYLYKIKKESSMASPKSTKKTSNGIASAFNNTKPDESLDAKLNSADTEIQQYVVALTSENLKFQKKMAKCEAEKITLQNRIVILKQDLTEAKQYAETAATVGLIETLRAQKDKK
jgi:hypothetical protein